MAAAAHAEPDGYTLVTSSIAYNAIEPIVSANPGFDPARDFTHVAFIGGQPDVFLVSTKSDLRSLKDVVELARRGAPPNYVSPGLATFSQLLVEVFALEAGIKFQHIPHRGSSQAMIDLVAGNVPFGDDVGLAIGQVRAGTVPVAISSRAGRGFQTCRRCMSSAIRSSATTGGASPGPRHPASRASSTRLSSKRTGPGSPATSG
jgi:tripartite-type tricarboxylate transporter receptor subunit TctC